MVKRNSLSVSIIAVLVISMLVGFSVNTIKVLAPEFSVIMVLPETTIVDPILDPPVFNYTVSIYTNSTSSEINGFQFTLSFDPNVLHGGINASSIWAGNGTKTTFDTTRPMVVEDSETVFVNQTLTPKNAPASDTWTGTGVKTVFNTTYKPLVEDSETVYENAIERTRATETNDTWTGDGSNRTYFTTYSPVVTGVHELDLYVNKTFMWPGINYTLNYLTGNITFVTAPGNGADILALYWYGHYTVDYEKGEITFVTAPANGAGIEATYQHVQYTVEYEPYGKITFTTAPGNGAEIKAIYLYGGVILGNLMSGEPWALFSPGSFNNTSGNLTLSIGSLGFFPPYPVVTGPGILANVTFTVVGYGCTDITLGPTTLLTGMTDGGWTPYTITDQVQHGYFRNKLTGDADGNPPVNILDILKVKFHWYPGPPVGTGGYERNVDINDDGSINILDILLVKANWGRTITLPYP